MSFIIQEIPAPTVFGAGQATAVAAGNIINYYLGEQDFLILTSNASSNWTVNLEYDPTTSLNVAMQDGDVAKFSLGVTNGNPAYVQTGFTIDDNPSGISFTWASGVPTVGFASAINFYDFEVLKIGNETYDVRAALTSNTTFKTIPNAPSAPVASALSSTEVRVTVTNPTNTGGLSIIEYLVSSSTGISQASGASPITITGLSSGVPVNFTARVRNAVGLSNQSSASNTVTPVTPDGEQIFGTTAGTYSWIAPNSITNVSVLCIGAGANRHGTIGGDDGGGGGALAYKNNITVVPSTSYTVVVGAAGGAGSSFTASFGTCTAGSASLGNGGTRSGTTDGGGNGGTGGTRGGPGGAGGGAGAGGYSGNGGNGGYDTGVAPTAGAGGGGGGGGAWTTSATPRIPAAGGGVGIYGAGSNGAAGANSSSFVSPPTGGGGGSGGTNGGTDASATGGGLYGGGGAGAGNSAAGKGGVVRIIWAGSSGITRAFPSTNVGPT